MRSRSDGYVAGRVWAICDRCGTKKDRADLRADWKNLLVCSRCFDPKPADLEPPYIDPFEGAPVKNPRPRAPDSFVGADVWTTIDGASWSMRQGGDWSMLGQDVRPEDL